MKHPSKFAFILFGIGLMGIFLSPLAFAYADSDVSLSAKSIKDSMYLKIEKFVIKGERYKEMCPSGQCIIDYVVDNYTYFIGPRSEFKAISVTFDFSLRDDERNVTDVNPMKNDSNDHFTITTFCNVVDNTEENAKGIYTCHDGYANIIRKSDHKSWELNSVNQYDKKTRAVNIIGNITGLMHKFQPSPAD